MKTVFIEILNMSYTGGIVACAVILARFALKKAPKIFSYVLWAVVLFRLVCPFTFESAASLMPGNAKPVPQSNVTTNAPAIQRDIAAVDNAATLYPVTNIPGDKEADETPAMPGMMEVGACIWLLGAAALFGYALLRYLKLRRGLKTAVKVKDNIYETDRIATPFVLGFLKPNIYLPIGMEDADYILKHEQTHIRRLDYLVKPAAFLVLCLHWFNPVIWLSYYLCCKDMEMSCDESVLRRSENDIRWDYSGSLLSLSVKQSGLLSPLSFGESNTKTRVKNVLGYKKPAIWISVLAVIAVLSMTVGFAANRVSEHKTPLQEATGATLSQAELIEDILMEHTIEYSSVAISNNPFMEGMDVHWQAYDLVAEDGTTHVLVLRKEDCDFTALLNSEGRLMRGLIDNGVTPALFKSEAEAVNLLISSLRYTDGQVLFQIPIQYNKPHNWNIHIAGRAEFEDGFSMSVHEFEDVNDRHAWEAGKWHSIPIEGRHLTELTMDVMLPGDTGVATEKSVDLLASMQKLGTIGDAGGILIDGDSEHSYLWPLADDTQISASFGTRAHPVTGTMDSHDGIDIEAPAGTPILAAKAGTVIEIGENDTEGLYVLLDHGAGLQTFYAHMNGYAEGIATGAPVEKGDMIGYVGSTGASTGSHLHFGISVDGVYINPLESFN